MNFLKISTFLSAIFLLSCQQEATITKVYIHKDQSGTALLYDTQTTKGQLLRGNGDSVHFSNLIISKDKNWIVADLLPKYSEGRVDEWYELAHVPSNTWFPHGSQNLNDFFSSINQPGKWILQTWEMDGLLPDSLDFSNNQDKSIRVSLDQLTQYINSKK